MDRYVAPNVAVVIPAYNEASTIADVATRARRQCKRVIVVNDCSLDDTAARLNGIDVTVLHNPANFGKGESIRIGAAHALSTGADAIITLDGDGQHRPEDIPLLLDISTTHPEKIVIAARLRDRRTAPPLRRFANSFADFWISWAAGQRLIDTQSGFRLYPAGVLRHCTARHSGFVFESEVLIDAVHKGFKVVVVPIDTIYHPHARPSHYRPFLDTMLIVKVVAAHLLRKGLYPMGLIRASGLAGNSHGDTTQLKPPQEI